MNQERQKKLAIDALAMPAEEREKYLSAECGNDSAAREHIQNRIAKVENFWAADGSGKDGRREIKEAANVISVGERPGDTIDRYTLLEKIGEGGMGVVWLAEQHHPVKRKVALKIIKLGMDTAEVVVRFEAERQALAMMEHPNIASIIDGGVTGQGRPYFAMELVRGEMITCYCDRMQFALERRLRLFIDVCRAVRHAHEKGVIHRDLKPSNVLVTERGDLPIVKVIDFGVAKAVIEPLTDKAFVTKYGQMIGTPIYMSPEQAETGGLDVDARSDVYSLGVLLYELITGTTPLEKARTSNASFPDVQRLICEENADRPSHRVTTLGKSNDLPAIARQRNIAPERLRKLLKGDLDWIIMKALEKDRTRRYQSASALIADLERYLNHEVVTARPPSRLYRLKKSLQRNRSPYGALAAVALTLAVGAGISIWQSNEAKNSRAGEHAANQRLRSHLAETEGGSVKSATTPKQGDTFYNQIKTFPGSEFTSIPGVSFPHGLPTIVGSRARFPGAPTHAILMRVPLVSAGTLSPARLAKVTISAQHEVFSPDGDVGFYISDGTRIIGSWVQNNGNGSLLAVQAPDAGTTAYPDVESLLFDNAGFSNPIDSSSVFSLMGASEFGLDATMETHGSGSMTAPLLGFNVSGDLEFLLVKDNVAEECYYNSIQLRVEVVGDGSLD